MTRTEALVAQDGNIVRGPAIAPPDGGGGWEPPPTLQTLCEGPAPG